jgi:hypothetical protein
VRGPSIAVITRPANDRKIALVAARLDATKAVMQRWKEGETLAANDRSLFLKPDVLFIQDERLATLRLRLTVRCLYSRVFLRCVLCVPCVCVVTCACEG